MLTNDQNILPIVKGYKITLDTIPHQDKTPKNVCENSTQESLMDTEVSEMPNKGAISLVHNQEKGFLINLFQVEKRMRLLSSNKFYTTEQTYPL